MSLSKLQLDPTLYPYCKFDSETSDELHTLIYNIDDIHHHANSEICKVTRYIPTPVLLWAVEESIMLWNQELILWHFKRIMAADLSYPILMHETMVIDGVHRIAKASMLGISMLKVHDLQTLPPPNEIS